MVHSFSLNYNHQVLILGPTGCGKTALVQRVAKDCGLVLRTIVGPELCSPLPGEAERALTAVFDECRLLAQECTGGCLLLLDQVESLCGRPGDSTESHVVRLASHLLSLLESAHNMPGLVIVGTTSRPHALHPAARRPGHFDHEIHIGVSTESERVSILLAVTRHHGLCDSPCAQVAQWTPGFVGADLALLASNVARHLERLGLPANYADEESLLQFWRSRVCLQQPTALRGQLGVVQGERGDFSQLGGVSGVRLKLLQAVQWPLSHPEAFRRLGLPQPKGENRPRNAEYYSHQGQALGKRLLADSSSGFTRWLMGLGRDRVKQVIALITGHGHFRKHLNTLGLRNEDSECRLCNKSEETANT
ncbi:spermatogenesis-associated protein 5-like protein 1 [Homalodisca vitripennis]|nr:spermatogenesis-associated protein 5-like protein 1 [Homalodisca vitripennis]